MASFVYSKVEYFCDGAPSRQEANVQVEMLRTVSMSRRIAVVLKRDPWRSENSGMWCGVPTMPRSAGFSQMMVVFRGELRAAMDISTARSSRRFERCSSLRWRGSSSATGDNSIVVYALQVPRDRLERGRRRRRRLGRGPQLVRSRRGHGRLRRAGSAP